MKVKHGYILLGALSFILSGCQIPDVFGKNQESESGEHTDKKFEGISLHDATFIYDGAPHSIEVQGDLPEGSSVVYGDNGNSFTAVGTYTVTATVSAPGYETLQLSAVLKISYASMEGIVFNDYEVTYDGEPHSIAPVVPEKYAGAEVTYSENGNTFTEIGEYKVDASVSLTGFETWNGSAVLKITPKEFTGLSLSDETVYFDNQEHTIEFDESTLPEGATFTYDEGHQYFKDIGEWVVSGVVKKEYYSDLHLEATLKIIPYESDQPFVIYDFEGKTDNDISDDFIFDKYDGDWIATSARFTGVDNQEIGEGSRTGKFGIWHHNVRYRASRYLVDNYIDIRTFKKYSGFKIDTLVEDPIDGETEIIVQFGYRDLPLTGNLEPYKDSAYISYYLDHDAPMNWTHWEVPFDGYKETSIVGGAITEETLNSMGYKISDFTPYIDRVSVLAKANYTQGGENTYVYVDNITLDNVKYFNQIQYVNVANRKYTVTDERNHDWSLEFNDDVTGVFRSLNLVENEHYDFTYLVESNKVIVTFNVEGETKYYFDAIKGGSQLIHAAPSGTLFDDTIFKEYFLVDDFESYLETGTGYDQQNLKEDVSGLRAAYFADRYNEGNSTPSPIDSKWSLINTSSFPNYIKLEDEGNHGKSMSVSCNGDNQMRYTSFGLLDGAKAIGKGNKFSIALRGSDSGTMKVRVFYENKVTAANQGSTSGSCAYFDNLAVSTDWETYELDINPAKTVYGVLITSPKKNMRLYVDDMYVYTDVSPLSAYYEKVGNGRFGYKVNSDLYTLDIKESATEALLAKNSVGLIAFDVHQEKDKLILKDSDTNGSELSVVMKHVNGDLVVYSASGSMASDLSMLSGKTFKKGGMNIVVNDFQDKTVGGPLNDPYWSGPQMNVRNSGDNIFINLPSGYGNTSTYTRTLENPLTGVGEFQIDVGNDYSGCADIYVKVKLVKTDSSEVYIVGDADNFVKVPANTAKFAHIDVSFEEVDITAIKFLVKSNKNGNDYLYIDNIMLSSDLSDGLPEPSMPLKTVSDGKYYLFNSKDDAYTLEINNDVTSATLTKVGSEPMALNVVVNGESLTFSDGNGLIEALAVITRKNEFGIISLSGALVNSELEDALLYKVFTQYSDLYLDFSDGSSGSSYKGQGWEKFIFSGGKWSTNSGDAMYCKNDANSNKIINMYVASGYSAYGYEYTPALSTGPVSNLNFRLGNYYDHARDVDLRIILINPDGEEVCINCVGDEYENIPYVPDSYGHLIPTHYDFDLMVVSKIRFELKVASGDTYLYIDDLSLS